MCVSQVTGTLTAFKAHFPYLFYHCLGCPWISPGSLCRSIQSISQIPSDFYFFNQNLLLKYHACPSLQARFRLHPKALFPIPESLLPVMPLRLKTSLRCLPASQAHKPKKQFFSHYPLLYKNPLQKTIIFTLNPLFLHQSTLFLQLPLPIWLEIKHYNKLNGNVTVYYINSKNHFLLDSAKQKIIKNIVTSAEKKGCTLLETRDI